MIKQMNSVFFATATAGDKTLITAVRLADMWTLTTEAKDQHDQSVVVGLAESHDPSRMRIFSTLDAAYSAANLGRKEQGAKLLLFDVVDVSER